MTENQRQTELTEKKRQPSRHLSQPNVFYFFSAPHFLKTILASRTNGTFGFARHTSRPFAKPKEPFFANAHKTTLTEIKLTLHNILLNFALSN
ncbi:MAG: hypothetical protein ACOVOQ_11930 [Flavobacterium sp.]